MCGGGYPWVSVARVGLGGGAELGGRWLDIAFPVLEGEHRAATLTPVSLIMQRRPRPRTPTTALPRSFLTRQPYLGGFVTYEFQRFLFNDNLLQLY
jgi:hypothetical protein